MSLSNVSAGQRSLKVGLCSLRTLLPGNTIDANSAARLGTGFAELHYELSVAQYARLHAENLQVLLFMTLQTEAISGNPASIIYPTKTTLHIGGMEVPRKYQGLKGKPWTAAPADITAYTKKGKKSTVQVKFEIPSDKYEGIKVG